MNYQDRAKQISDRINELASISEQPGMVTRTYGSPSFLKGAQLVSDWMHKAGLKTHIDNIGNVRGRWLCNESNAKTLIIASHIDTVVNAGKFDGTLGVIMGLDAIEHLINNKINVPYNIELIAFADEEGVRFHTTYLGSKVVAGSFDRTLLSRTDKANISLSDTIKSIGGNPDLLLEDAIHDELLG